MVIPPGEQHGVGGGLWSLTVFLVLFDVLSAIYCIQQSNLIVNTGTIRLFGTNVEKYKKRKIET